MLKKTFFTCLVVLLFSLTANSQITKGNWMVGGSGSFSTVKFSSELNGSESSSKGTSINISPNIGYFIIDKLAGGIKANLNFYFPGESDNNSRGFAIGPYARYYFLDIDKRVNILAEINSNFGRSSNVLGNKNDTFGYGIMAGPVIYFNNSVALEFTMNYNYNKTKRNNGGTSQNNQFLVAIGFQIHLEK